MFMMSTRILLQAIGVAIALCRLATAAPAPASNPFTYSSPPSSSKAAGSFSVDQVKLPYTRKVSYTNDYVSTLRKHNAPVPAAVYGGVQSRDSNLAERQTENEITGADVDGIWAYHIYVGTPAYRLYVWFDTGSPDLWVFSSALPANETSNHYVYTPSSSSTSRLFTGQTWDLTYGAGEASGNVYWDVLTVGTFTIPGYPLEAATYVTANFYDASGIDGIFGFDRNFQLSQTQAEPSWLTFYNLYPTFMYYGNYFYDITLFTVNHQNAGGGTWTFAAIDSSQYTGTISYTPTFSGPDDDYWWMNTTGYAVGTGSTTTLALGIILDTGSYVAVLPTAVASAYWSHVTGSELYNGQYVFPCTSTLPDFHITLQGGYVAVVHGAYINAGSITGDVPSSSYCYGMIQPTTGNAVFGASFFESLFVVFDYANTRIGVATKTLT